MASPIKVSQAKVVLEDMELDTTGQACAPHVGNIVLVDPSAQAIAKGATGDVDIQIGKGCRFKPGLKLNQRYKTHGAVSVGSEELVAV